MKTKQNSLSIQLLIGLFMFTPLLSMMRRSTTPFVIKRTANRTLSLTSSEEKLLNDEIHRVVESERFNTIRSKLNQILFGNTCILLCNSVMILWMINQKTDK